MKVRYLYDGECPLRKPEVELLQRLDAGKVRQCPSAESAPALPPSPCNSRPDFLAFSSESDYV